MSRRTWPPHDVGHMTSPFGEWDETVDQGWAGDTWPEEDAGPEYRMFKESGTVRQCECPLCHGAGSIVVVDHP